MTLRRFQKLADSYGGDLRRWPEGVRAQASALLQKSSDARRIVARAADLDQAIAAASTARNVRIWGTDRADRARRGDAALERLRIGVAARTRPTGIRDSGLLAETRESRSLVAPFRRAGWMGLATAASIAVVAGLALGVLHSPAAPSQSLFSLLQPAPFESLAD